jgi:hypothetical protein
MQESGPTKWTFPLIKTLQDKSVPRTGLQPPTSPQQPEPTAEEAGVDGSLNGGLRPLSGFKNVRELDFQSDPNHDTTSVVLDARAIAFSLDSSSYAYGIVYKVARSNVISSSSGEPGDSKADIFVDFYNSRTDVWTTGTKVMDEINANAQFDVAEAGRLVYVFATGRSPSRFYVKTDNSVDVLGLQAGDPTPGPGIQPELISPEDSAIALGSLAPPTSTEQPARGQVKLTQLTPTQTGLFIFDESITEGSSSSGGVDLSAVNQDALAFQLEFGDYVFGFRLRNSETGSWSAFSSIAQARGRNFNLFPGSTTSSGGESNKFIDMYAAMEILYDETEFDQAWIYRSVKVQDAGGTFVAAIQQLDNIIDLADYHTFDQPDDVADGRWRRAIYFYELEDKQLLYQDFYLDRATFDEEMPHGGAALFYENTMIISSIQQEAVSAPGAGVIRPHDTERGLGETRWSSLSNYSPELFPPSHRFTPNIPTNEVQKFIKIGGNVIGFSIDRMYHLRKETVFIRVSDLHEGFGIANPHAADTTGSFAYFTTRKKGLKAVDSVGQLDVVQAIDNLLVSEWGADAENFWVSFDPDVGALFILNTVKSEMAVLWLTTSRVTHLYDTVFDVSTRGPWPSDLADDASTLTERALFIQNTPDSDVTLSGWKPRVFVLDHKREKVVSSSAVGDDDQPALRTLDPTGDARFEVATDYDSSTRNVSVTSVAGDPQFGTKTEGCKVYVIQSDTVPYGTSAIINRRPNPTRIQVISDDASVLDGLKAGDRIAISPVRFKVETRPITSTMTTQGFGVFADEFFQIKKADRLGCAFADVSGTATDDTDTADDKYQASLFKGSETAKLATAFPLARDGTSLVNSIVDNEPVEHAAFSDPASNLQGRYGVRAFSLTPSMEVLCPDLDFKLLGMIVYGRITAEATDRRSV